jgi:integrase/recombinase XerD
VKCITNNEVVLSRPPDGPVAAHIVAFARSQSTQGYTRSSIHRQVLLAAAFSHWLKQQGVALPHVDCDHTSLYLRDRARRVRPCLGDAAALRHLLDFLRREGVTAAEKITPCRMTPAERCAHEYGQQHLPRPVQPLTHPSAALCFDRSARLSQLAIRWPKSTASLLITLCGPR